ncbi:MAG: hypothetical protein QOF60_728 [Actinomycetota bacterium]|jgi:hypothetical protein|nr:hypothetical protein [Actinomycetota bacterium]
MDRFSSVTLGDISAGLRRYWPAAVTALLIALMAAFLPGHRPGSPGGLFGASAPPPVAVAAGSGSGSSDGSASDAGSSGSAVSDSAYDSGPVGFAIGPSPSFGGNSATTFGGDENAAAPDAPLVSSPSGSGFGSGGSSSSGGGGRSVPLTLSATLWATNGSGTPLATQDVPDGSLPVGKRVGQEDKRSYVRLSGTDTVLRLSEVGSGRSTGGSVVSVQACRVTQAGWAEGRGVALSSAPPFDSTACVKGERATDGVWEFDLSAYSDRTDAKGFALVVAPDGGVDFQVNFTSIA